MPKYAIHVKQFTYAVRFVEADSEQEALDSYNGVVGAPDLTDIEYDMDFLCEDEEFVRIEEHDEQETEDQECTYPCETVRFER